MLHPSVLPHLSPEYVTWHDSLPSDLHAPPITDWDEGLRTGRTSGVKMGRDPVEGVRTEEVTARWKGGEGAGFGVGEKEREAGECGVGVFWPEGEKGGEVRVGGR